MNIKKISAVILAVSSLCVSASALADTDIDANTIADNCVIGEYNQQTNVWSYDYGTDDIGSTVVINPVTLYENVNANVLNSIQNIVNVNCNINLSDISDMIAKTQERIWASWGM